MDYYAAELIIDTNNLTGLSTTEFQIFTDITYLDLSNNRFSGDFTTIFAGLNNLGKIDMFRKVSQREMVSHPHLLFSFRVSHAGKQPHLRNYPSGTAKVQ